MNERKFFYKNEIKITDTGMNLIDFIEKNPKKFIKMSISEIAKEIFISISTISKTAKKLKFSNFKELQTWVSSQIANIEEYKLIDKPKKINDYSIYFANIYKRAIDRTISDLDINKFKQIKKILDQKKHIYTFGIGSSNLAAQELSESLNIIGYSSSNLENIHHLFMGLNENNFRNRILFIFSKGLRSQEIKVIRKVLSNHNFPIIIFTANHNHKENSNEIFVRFRTVEQNSRIIASTSKISQLLLTDIFINWIGKKDDNKIYKDFSDNWRN